MSKVKWSNLQTYKLTNLQTNKWSNDQSRNGQMIKINIEIEEGVIIIVGGYQS